MNEQWPRIILHADMDAFFAAVEQRDRSDLVGRPVIVGGLGARSVVSTASYEARKFGVHSAMPMSQALRRCPNAVVLPPDFERYRETSAKINEVFHLYSPLVEPLSLDEAFVDMSGAERLFGEPAEMGRRIKRDVREITCGLTISVGVSVNKYTAKVASDFQKPDGLTVVPADAVLGFLHPLPVSRLWGAGERTQQSLTQNGFRTIGDVAAASPEKLRRVLGSMGERFWELSRGIDPREVIPERDAKSIGKEYTLETDVRGASEILPILRTAADNTARSLRKKGLEASGVRVKLKTADFRLLTRQCVLPSATDSAPPILTAADRLLEKLPLDQPFRLVGLAVFELRPKGAVAQISLFPDPSKEKQTKLDRALDAVREKFGDPALRRAVDAEIPATKDEGRRKA